MRYRYWDPDGAGTAFDPAFRYVSGTWNPVNINACPSTVPAVLPPTSIPDGQAVGVYLKVAHQGIVKAFFDTTMDLSDRNVVRFEPMRISKCKP